MARQASVRETQQRRVVFETMRGTRTHPTADWIFEQVRGTLPKISLGTVYRNLSVLKAEGMVREVCRHRPAGTIRSQHRSARPLRLHGMWRDP